MARPGLSELKTLSREREESPTTVPRPRFHWKTRVLLPGLILGGMLFLTLVTSYRTLFPAVQVIASPVVLKSVSGPVAGAVIVQAAGWVEADPYKSYVTALTHGVVREVLVLEGEEVQSGQVVVRLIDDDAKLAVHKTQAAVAELGAALAAAQAELEAARTEWENPVERTRALRVAEAELAEGRAALEEARAELILESARLEHAKSDHDRANPLHESKSISEAEYIRIRSQYDAQRAKIEATKSRIAVIEAKIGRYEAQLAAAQEHMRLRIEEKKRLDLAIAAVQRAEAALAHGKRQLEEAQLRLDRMEIRSPIAGVVMRRLVEPGSKVVVVGDNPTSAYALSLYDPNRLQVRVDVPLADAAKIGVGQPAEIVAEVLPGRAFAGTVTRVLHEANIQKNTLEVKVALRDPDPALRPEMLGRVKFLAKSEHPEDQPNQMVFAPDSGFKRQGGNVTAWIVRSFNGTFGVAKAQPVQLGSLKIDGWNDVRSGLQVGDLVITQAPADLREGARVRVVVE